jgi:regulatory protein
VEGAIERLISLGYLDDAEFARAWVESRDRAHPRGAGALRRELRLKGVADDVIADVLADRAALAPQLAIGVSVDDAAAARLLERKRATLLREPDPRRRRQRAYSLLARSGFDPGVCSAASLAWVRDHDPEPRVGDDDGPEVPSDP